MVEAVIWHDAVPNDHAMAVIEYWNPDAARILTRWADTDGTQRERMAALGLPGSELRGLFALWRPEDDSVLDVARMASCGRCGVERAWRIAHGHALSAFEQTDTDTTRARLTEALEALDA